MIRNFIASSTPELGKFVANCLKVCGEVGPHLAVGAAVASATGPLVLLGALGAAGFVVADLLTDIKQGKDLATLKDLLTKLDQKQGENHEQLSSSLRIQSLITAHDQITLTEIIKELKELPDYSKKSPTFPAENAYQTQPLKDWIQSNPELSESIIELIETAAQCAIDSTYAAAEATITNARENTRAIIQANQLALLQLTEDQQLPKPLRDSLIATARDIRNDLKSLESGHRDIKKLVALVIVLIFAAIVVVQKGNVAILEKEHHGQEKIAYQITSLSNRLDENHSFTTNQIEESRRTVEKIEVAVLALEENKPSEANNATVALQPEASMPAVVRQAFDAYDLHDGRNDPESRFSATEQLIKVAAGDARAWFLRGYAAFQLAKASGDDDKEKYYKIAADSGIKALDLIEQGSRSDLLALTLTNLGAAQSYLGQLSSSETNHKRAIDKNPKLPLAYLNLENVYDLMGPAHRRKQIQVLRNGYAANPESKEIMDRFTFCLRNFAFDMSQPFSERIAAMREVLATPEPPFAWRIENVLVYRYSNMPEEEGKALLEAKAKAGDLYEKAEATIFQAAWKMNHELNYDPVTDPELRAAGTAILTEIKRDSAKQDPMQCFFYLAASYHFLLGDYGAADRYASKIKPTGGFRNMYETFKSEQAVRDYQRDFGNLIDQDISAKELEEQFSKTFRSFSKKLFGKEIGDQADEFGKDYESMVLDCMARIIREDWDGLLVIAKQYQLKHSGGVIYGAACAFAGLGKFKTNDFEGAIEEFEEGFDHDLNMKQGTQLYYARSLDMVGRRQEAEPVFRELYLKQPSNPDNVRYLSMMLSDLGRDDEAIGLAREFLELVPDDTSIRDLLGCFLFNQAERLMDTPGDNLESGERQAIAQKSSELYLESYRQNSLSENKQLALSRFAGVLSDISSPESAIAIGSKAIEELKTAGDISGCDSLISGIEGHLRYLAATQTVTEVHHIPKAELETIKILLESGTRAMPRPFEWDVNLAWTRISLGQGIRATDHLRSLIDSGPTNLVGNELERSVHLNLAHIHSFQAFEDPARTDHEMCRLALRHFDAAMKISPENDVSGYMWALTGDNRRILGDYSGSVVAFRRSVELDPERYLSWINLSGMQLRCLNVPGAALSSLNSFRYFRWGSPGEYRALFPMTANLLMAFGLIWIPAAALFFRRLYRRRRLKACGGAL